MNTMKKASKSLLVLALLAAAGASQARNTTLTLPLDEVIRMGVEQGKLDGSVKFYLSGAKTPRVAARMGEDVANKKTNGVGKDDAYGCKWAALSALIAFQETAKQRGANAVVDLHSYYKRTTYRNPTNYECHAGAVVIGVTFKGTFAKV